MPETRGKVRVAAAPQGSSRSEASHLGRTEVHGVEVIPLPAPDEAMPLEDLDDLERDAITVDERLTLFARFLAHFQ